MFDELKNLNVKTCSEAKLIALVRQTLPIITFHVQASQELLERSGKNSNQIVLSEEVHEPQKIAIANGRKLTEQELSNIDENSFDVILDLVANSLRYRKDPKNRTELEKSKLKNIGSRRMEILLYLLEHPTRYISIENISYLPQQSDIVEPNSLVKSMSLIREALGKRGKKNPYLITEPSLGSTYSRYKINPQWHYLIIKNIIKITDKSDPGEQ